MSKKGGPKAAAPATSATAIKNPKAAPAAPAKAAPAATEGTTQKSIVDPKYRNKYATPDWLGALIAGAVQPMVDKVKTIVDGETKSTKTVKVPGEVDVDALFALAKENGLDVAKYESAARGHGFGGRMRMTIRNMLQATAKQRHGVHVNGKFKEAPAEWLAEKKAPEAPTHKKDGTKIVVAKPAKEKPAKDAAKA